ncbi:hypothetical protein C8J57DRAFT_1234303 [Mycena rebaudengoi]|nr:hypothetical protein C8J57DRAFT_1234303 [Mycena rebaudengoi]
MWAEVTYQLPSTGTKLWLERSTPLPLEIDLEPNFDFEECHLKTMSIAPLVDTLLSVAHRWKSLRFTAKLLKAIGQITPGTLTPQTKLNARWRSIYHRDIIPLSPSSVKGRTFCLPQASPFAMGATHSLTLHAPLDPPMAANILMQCTSIISTNLAIDGGSELDSAATSVDRHSLVPILQRFRLPNLKNFAIAMDDMLDDDTALDWPATAVKGFPLRSPNIKDINISQCPFMSEDLRAVLMHTLHLVQLQLWGCLHCINNNFFAALQYSESDSMNLTPMLTNLDL